MFNVRKILTSFPFLLGVAVVPVAISVWLSAHTHNWSWMVRSASFLMIGGVLMISRKLIRLGIRGIVNETWIRNGGSFEPLKLFSGGHAREERWDRIALGWGIAFVISGLLLWAYGDFIYM